MGLGRMMSSLRHALESDGTVRVIDQTNSYVSMPGDRNTIPSLAVAVKKL